MLFRSGMLLTRRMERAGLKPLGFVATDYVIAVWSLRPVRGLDPAEVEDVILGGSLSEGTTGGNVAPTIEVTTVLTAKAGVTAKAFTIQRGMPLTSPPPGRALGESTLRLVITQGRTPAFGC